VPLLYCFTAVRLQINNGHVEAAEEILNKLLENNPAELSALVARGTARALRRDLQGAEADFTKAIEIEPRWVGFNGPRPKLQGLVVSYFWVITCGR
jgi:tetratricopeptide (TPR) repeat protein